MIYINDYYLNYKMWFGYLYKNQINIILFMLIFRHCKINLLIGVSIYNRYLLQILFIPYLKYFFLKKLGCGGVNIDIRSLWISITNEKMILEYLINIFLYQLYLLFYNYKEINEVGNFLVQDKLLL